MSESDETHKRLARMERDLGDIEAMTRTLLRAQGKERREEILQTMKEDKALRSVYLMVDGDRGVTEIAEAVKDVCAKRTVERKLDELEHDWGLIVFVLRRNPGGKVYRRSPADRALGISRQLKG